MTTNRFRGHNLGAWLQPKAFWQGWASCTCSLLLLLCALLPARLGRAFNYDDAWFDELLQVVAGMALDFRAIAALVVPAIIALSLLPAVISRWKSARWQALGPPLLSLPFCFLAYLASVVAQEFRLERGAFPTAFDLAQGLGNWSFLASVPDYLAYERLWLPLLVGLALATVALVWHRRRSALTASTWRAWVCGLLLSASCAVGLAWLVPGISAKLSPQMHAGVIGDPLLGMVESLVDATVQREAPTTRELIATVDLPTTEQPLGAALLGWPPSSNPTKDCATHPHARPLDFRREPWAADAPGRALLESLAALSVQLFTDTRVQPIVVMVSLEGFRGHDLHALNANAPASIAPFVNGLYERSNADEKTGTAVLASRKTYQAGVRTAQGLGALLCGLGTLPYNLSWIRDLQPIKSRCLGDVLRDAGFQNAFYYGSDPDFDNMRSFLQGHGFARVLGQRDWPGHLPRGVWQGVTDVALIDHAMHHLANAVQGQVQPFFAFVLTLSNHSPYTEPQDLPPLVHQRVNEALASSKDPVGADHRRRMLTQSYTDFAVAHLFAQLERYNLANRTIVVMAADHATGERFVWQSDSRTTPPELVKAELELARAHVPLVIALPAPFVERIHDRRGFDHALKRAQHALDQTIVSQNDLPHMLLALLGAHSSLRDLPASSKWHTLGGQVTSPWFDAGGENKAALVGINCFSQVYALDAAANRVSPFEESVFLRTATDRYWVTPRLVPIAATLAAMLAHFDGCQ